MFEIITTSKIKEIRELQEAFKRKKELENKIAQEIKSFEIDTGLAIDSIHYERDITLPIRGPRYTDLSIIITSEEN